MSKNLFIVLFLLSLSSVFAQESIPLKGKIIADSLQGSSINIVNISNFIGTSNAPDGSFEIEVRKNDTLFFSSVQFEKKKVVITSEIYSAGYLKVNLDEKINELAEVNISNVKLTGNLKTDVENIKIYDLPVNFNGKNTENLSFESDVHDPLSRPHNLALYGKKGLPGGVNLLGILGLITEIIPHKTEIKEPVIVKIPQGEMTTELRKIFDKRFFTDELHIKASSINEFIYYCTDHGLDSKMVAFENRLILIEFLKYQGKIYLALNEKPGGE